MYNGDLKWADLTKIAEVNGQAAVNALLHGLDAYNEWQSFRAGRNDAAIAQAISVGGVTVTAGQVAELDACFAALKELNDCYTGVAVTTLDRAFAVRKFT